MAESTKGLIFMSRKLQIFFFSGTGNARNVANWFGDKAAEKSFDVQINDLSKINSKNVSQPEADTLIGFISPTHGFNFPPVMMYFIFRFPKAYFDNKVFIINVRAGMKLGKIYFPGLSGITLWLSAIVLLIKGYKIVGLRSIDLPSNWISLHPSLRGNAVILMYERCKRITDKFAEDILNGKKNFRAFFDIIQDVLISPISIGYFLAGRFMFAKSFYANSLCNKCCTCIHNCPVKAIKLVNDQPYWTYHCESCMKCMNECPNRAIETGHGFVIGLLIITNSYILIQLWDYIFSSVKFDWNDPLFRAVRSVIDTIIYFILLFVSYRIIHSLKRIPVFKQIIEYTSLTKYNFWGGYNPKKIFAQKKVLKF